MEFFDPSLSPEQIYYVSAFSELESEGLPGLMNLLRAEISTRNPSILVLDGMVSAAEKASSGLELRKFIHELQGYASLFLCTIFLLGTTDTEAAVQVEHTMVEGVIDLADTSTAIDFQRSLHIPKFRGGSFIGGRHSFTISDAGTEIFPRLEATIRPPASLDPRPPLETGLARLNDISGIGGLRSSSCTLLSGPPGAGKTTFGAYFLSRASSEEPGLLCGFNESPAAMLSNADAHGIPFSRVLEEGFLHAHWRPSVENLLDELGHRLLRLVEQHRARRVFIDGLNGFVASAIYPQRIDRFIAALTLELRRLGATSIFTVEACDGNGRLPPAVTGLPALFDNLIVLRTIERGLRVKRLLSVTKMRGCDFDQTLHAYSFEDEGLVIGNAIDGELAEADRDGTVALGRADDPA